MVYIGHRIVPAGIGAFVDDMKDASRGWEALTSHAYGIAFNHLTVFIEREFKARFGDNDGIADIAFSNFGCNLFKAYR